MRQLLVIVSTVALLAFGAAIAIACKGGSTGHGNAGWTQYHPKPGCHPDKPGYPGWPGSHGYGSPSSKGHDGECPKPPGCVDRYGHLVYSSSDGPGEKCDNREDQGHGSDQSDQGHGSDQSDQHGYVYRRHHHRHHHNKGKPGKGRGGHH